MVSISVDSIVQFSLYVHMDVIFFQELISKSDHEVRRKKSTAHRANLKLITILLYFLVLTVITLVIDIISTSLTPNLYLGALLPYFTCESFGQGGERDCQRLLSRVQKPRFVNLSVAFGFLSGLLPLVIFFFSADFPLIIKRAKRVVRNPAIVSFFQKKTSDNP